MLSGTRRPKLASDWLHSRRALLTSGLWLGSGYGRVWGGLAYLSRLHLSLRSLLNDWGKGWLVVAQNCVGTWLTRLLLGLSCDCLRLRRHGLGRRSLWWDSTLSLGFADRPRRLLWTWQCLLAVQAD